MRTFGDPTPVPNRRRSTSRTITFVRKSHGRSKVSNLYAIFTVVTSERRLTIKIQSWGHFQHILGQNYECYPSTTGTETTLLVEIRVRGLEDGARRRQAGICHGLATGTRDHQRFHLSEDMEYVLSAYCDKYAGNLGDKSKKGQAFRTLNERPVD